MDTALWPCYGCCSPAIGSGQPLAEVAKDSLQEEYIRSYPDYFYIKPLWTTRNLSLRLSNANTLNALNANAGRRINYRPNNVSYAGFGIYFFDLGLEASLKVPENDPKNAAFGETRIFDFQANIYSKKVGADLIYQKYKGFYIDDPAQHFEDWKEGDAFPQRSDLELSTIYANGFYIFNNERFSFRSAFNQADRQLKSQGSFFLTGSFSIIKVESDSSLIPAVVADEFGKAKGFRGGKFTTLAVLPGYGHNFIVKKFYLNIALSLGPGHQWKQYALGAENVDDREIKFVTNIRAGLGYNGNRFFSGVSTFWQNVTVDVEGMAVSGISSNLKLFVGYRFEEKGFLKKNLFKH